MNSWSNSDKDSISMDCSLLCRREKNAFGRPVGLVKIKRPVFPDLTMSDNCFFYEKHSSPKNVMTQSKFNIFCQFCVVVNQ